MSKHDSVTKRKRRPKSDKRVDYTARTMAIVKQLSQAEKLSQSQTALLKRAQGAQELRAQTASGDYVIAFSTAPQMRIQTERTPRRIEVLGERQ